MKILWLVSWYPNRKDRFDGDFIQRHARAAAICHNVHVIFVTDAEMDEKTDQEWNYATGLTEQIIYFKKKKGFGARLRKQLAWKNICRDAVKKYIAKNGLPDVVHVHVPWKAGLIALWMKKKYRRDFIISEHWGLYHTGSNDSVYNRSHLSQNLLKKIYSEAKAFISVSNYLAGEVQKFSGRKRDLIIPNVVDTTLFYHKEEKYSKFTFIHVSNMMDVKNVEGILNAFKKMLAVTNEAVQLLMVGNRDDKYVNLAGQLGLLNNSVFFRGEINYLQVAEEMRRSHCLVLFSDSETFSCVTAEALCCGLPVICPNVGALPELVNSSNGTLVSSNNQHALSISMFEMMKKYQSFNHKKISEEASRRFSYSAIAQRFDELYRNFC